jgi:hypothetical protein
MKVLVDKDILIGCYEILKKYYIVQEFTSVYKISKKEKMIYNAIAKIVEGKKNV